MSAAVQLAMIGTGSMGGSLLAGMLAADAPEDAAASPESTVATTKSAASAAELSERLGVTALAMDEDSGANARAVRGADFVFLGVKPYRVRETLAALEGELGPDQVLVSMAAGVSLETIRAAAPHTPAVRIMPNTPASIGKAVIALAADEEVGEERIDTLSALLGGAGTVVRVAEEQMAAMTAIAGSGVAYFFLLAEELVKAGVSLGLDESTARTAVVGTAEGAGLLLASDPDPARLRAAVTSKGGTTHAAITAFQEADLAQVVESAVRAAASRADELEAENS